MIASAAQIHCNRKHIRFSGSVAPLNARHSSICIRSSEMHKRGSSIMVLRQYFEFSAVERHVLRRRKFLWFPYSLRAINIRWLRANSLSFPTDWCIKLVNCGECEMKRFTQNTFACHKKCCSCLLSLLANKQLRSNNTFLLGKSEISNNHKIVMCKVCAVLNLRVRFKASP